MRVIASLVFFLVSIFCVNSTIAQAFPARYVEGVHYTALPKAVELQDPDRIEVVEVFWYACSHCYRLEPTVRRFEESLASDVNFVRMPAIWQPIMEVHARIFYTAKELGVLEDVHQSVFNAIHINRKQLKDADEVATLFEGFGVDKDNAVKVFNSGAVTDKIKQDYDKVRAYQISGTPQIIVHGRYRVEANTTLKQEDMFKVVEFLVDSVRAEK